MARFLIVTFALASLLAAAATATGGPDGRAALHKDPAFLLQRSVGAAAKEGLRSAASSCGLLRAPLAASLGAARRNRWLPCTRAGSQQMPQMPDILKEEGRDYIEYQDLKISFFRGAFGQVDDIKGEVIRADPFYADVSLSNEDAIKGKIAMVLRGSEEGRKCSFVDKANRVTAAGAIGVIVVNNEDTLLSPGDSAREGEDIQVPVVGIRRSDSEELPDGSKVEFHFHAAEALTSEQRKHLRATAIIRDNSSELTTTLLDDRLPSENILNKMDVLLSANELIKASFGNEDESVPLSILDIEDVIDVATVMADNLGAVVVMVSQSWFVMYRSSETCGDPIELPAVGEVSSLSIGSEDGLRGAMSIYVDDDNRQTLEETTEMSEE